MDAATILELKPTLTTFLHAFDGCFGRRTTRRYLNVYVTGELSDLDRKSVEPMADAAGVPPRSLQEFLSLFKWDAVAIRDRQRRKNPACAWKATPAGTGIMQSMSDKTNEPRAPVNTWKEFDQNVVSHSAAHHLMAIDDLVSRLGYARVSDIARQLNITRGSVSISLQPLKKTGLVIQDENRHLRLSETGQALVAGIKSKHEVVHRLLSEVLQVTPEQAEVDACKFEHLLSNESARQMRAFLRFLDADTGRGQEFVAAWRNAERKHGPAPAPEQPPRAATQHQPTQGSKP